jgi:hypothetical protein
MPTPSDSTNPPVPLAPNEEPVTYGTILHYGLENLAVTGIIIDSYRRDGSYANTDEISDQAGITVGIRMSDFRANVSIDGRVIAPSTYTVKAGDTLSINGDTIVIQSVSYSGQAKGFHSLSVSGMAYSGVVGLKPFGVA